MFATARFTIGVFVPFSDCSKSNQGIESNETVERKDVEFKTRTVARKFSIEGITFAQGA